MQTASARTTRLQAVYADTAGHHLAAAGMALRLRKEGRAWVQTLKGRGDGLAQRFEHEVVLTGVKGLPALDASLHHTTPLGPALQRALVAGGPLLPVYRTDIQRLHRRLRSGGAVIELALDRGHLIAGEQRALVHEIEFELVSGPPGALPALAARWAARFGLWWDVRTKSERGFKLATGLGAIDRTQASSLQAAHVSSAGLGPLLAQALRLAAALADLPKLASGAPAATGLLVPRQTHQIQQAHQLQRALQALHQTLLPRHAEWAAQVGTLHAQLADAAAAPGVVRSPAFTALMLRVMGLVLDRA